MAKKKEVREQTTFDMLRAFIKRQLKIRGMSYKDLARQMKVSEITVKRWLSRRAFSIDTLVEIGGILDFNVFDFIKTNYLASIHHQIYSEKQEEFLAKEPKAGLLLLKLIYNHDPEDLRKMLQMSQAEFLRLLRKADNLKFLELHPGEKIRFVMKGPFRGRVDGPYLKKYFPKMRDYVFAYFSKYHHRLREHPDSSNFEVCRPFEMYMTKESALQLSLELVQTISKYRQLTVLESKRGEKMFPVSGFVGVADYDLWKEVYLGRS